MRISNGIFLALVSLTGVLSLTGCFKPEYASNPDAKMGFRCHKSDSPACPASLVCCLDGVCGDDLKDSDEGWCIPPPPPVDLALTGLKYWPFPSKGMYFQGVYAPAQLSGYDEQMQWRCTRDDSNPNPPDAIRRMYEPNDFADAAVVMPNPLPLDVNLPPSFMGTAYQICPDKTAPELPDVDVFKFKLMSPAKLIVEIKYTAAAGDLDVAIFRMDKDPDTEGDKPTLIASDLTGVNDGCIEIPNLAQYDKYYIVVRGTVIPDQPGKYTMNDYRLRAFTVDPSGPGYSCMKRADMGP